MSSKMDKRCSKKVESGYELIIAKFLFLLINYCEMNRKLKRCANG